MSIKSRGGVGLRALVALGLLVCAYATARRGLAALYFRNPTPERIQQAIRYDPGRAQYRAALARVWQNSPTGASLDEVIRLYEQATALSPRHPTYWAELAGAYELAGRLPEAERAYERARGAAPNAPAINWQRGNFYLRQGKVELALDAFRPVLPLQPELRRQAFDLAWRATDDAALILERLIPPDSGIGFEYLNYLVETGRLEAAGQAWARLLSWGVPFEPRAALPYLDALIAHRQPERLQQAWAELAARYPLLPAHQPSDPEAITNGGFETDLLNGGLDWRVEPVEGAVVSVDNSTFFEGARSLQIRFEGRQNLDYRHIFQYVLVEPQTIYRFLYYVRTQGLTTDSGPCFQLTDAYEPDRVLLATRNLLGSAGWSLEQGELTTGPATRLLLIRLVRPPSRKFDNRIAGSVWIDHVSLTPRRTGANTSARSASPAPP